MSVTPNSLSEDARIVLGLISRSLRPRLTYAAANVLAMHPNHLAAHSNGEPAVADAGPQTARGCVAMDAQQVLAALDEPARRAVGWRASARASTCSGH